jgi:hypothetical protein
MYIHFSWDYAFKGNLTRDFLPLFFIRPLTHGLKPFLKWLRIREENQHEIADFGHTAVTENDPKLSAIFLCESYRYGVGQLAYVCFFEYEALCHSGVNDTDVLCADFLIKKTVLRIIREDIRQSLLHSSVNDTAMKCAQRCHLHHCATQLFRIHLRIRSYIRKRFI